MTTTEHELDALDVAAPILDQQQRQGDLLFTPGGKPPVLPAMEFPVTSEGIALTHDGHNHMASVDGWATWQSNGTRDYVIGWLEVHPDSVVTIFHSDPDPTFRHEPLRLAPGLWEVRRQRRHIPAIPLGWDSVLPARSEPAEQWWSHLGGGPVLSSKGWNGLDLEVC